MSARAMPHVLRQRVAIIGAAVDRLERELGGAGASELALMRAGLAAIALALPAPPYRAPTCAGCHLALPPNRAPGRARRWCSESCRVATYRRHRAAATRSKERPFA